MENNPFIEKAIRDFNGRNPDFVGVHDARLASILEQVKELPSPEKEERLVELIVNSGEAPSFRPGQQAAGDLPGALPLR